jgi:hypothetical protein
MTVTMTMNSIVIYADLFGFDIVVNGDTGMFDLYAGDIYLYSREW